MIESVMKMSFHVNWLEIMNEKSQNTQMETKIRMEVININRNRNKITKSRWKQRLYY